MKYLIIALVTLGLAACKEDSGVHLGTFKNDCSAKQGTLAEVAGNPNEYTCTLPDGTVLKTTEKK